QVSEGNGNIMGIMLESNLVEGTQKLKNPDDLVYGKSITDACIAWPETLELLREMGAGVREGRSSTKLNR
ncbi:MAG TPA: hypothetical protein VLK33_02495, partial [Terriglobales bacterium]|nr:hypothetical protein [Terriglobales bacterium]